MPARLGAVLCVAMIVSANASALPVLPDRLPKAESAKLALAAERAELEPQYRKRGLGVDFEGIKPSPHFFTWTVIPSWGQGVVYFAVDRRTGDVWAYLGCRLIRSRELALIQTRFRQQFGVAQRQVRRIERQGFSGC